LGLNGAKQRREGGTRASSNLEHTALTRGGRKRGPQEKGPPSISWKRTHRRINGAEKRVQKTVTKKNMRAETTKNLYHQFDCTRGSPENRSAILTNHFSKNRKK